MARDPKTMVVLRSTIFGPSIGTPLQTVPLKPEATDWISLCSSGRVNKSTDWVVLESCKLFVRMLSHSAAAYYSYKPVQGSAPPLVKRRMYLWYMAARNARQLGNKTHVVEWHTAHFGKISRAAVTLMVAALLNVRIAKQHISKLRYAMSQADLTIEWSTHESQWLTRRDLWAACPSYVWSYKHSCKEVDDRPLVGPSLVVEVLVPTYGTPVKSVINLDAGARTFCALATQLIFVSHI